jgi:CubicO group peptidase (beta-lactamase class C family)
MSDTPTLYPAALASDELPRSLLTPSNTVAWHGAGTGDHKALVDKWAKLGFRTLSLSIYDEPAHPLFAAVMIKRAAVHAEAQVFPRTLAQLQAEVATQQAAGRGMYLVGATGAEGHAVYAASFKPMAAMPVVQLDLGKADFQAQNAAQHAAGRILQWVDVFGDDANPRFAAIWGPNPGKVAWSVDGWDVATHQRTPELAAAALQQRFEAIATTGGRPQHIALAPAGLAAENFVDTTIGAWVSRGAMTPAQYQAEFDKQAKAGLMPLQVSARGAGGNARIAAIFAAREETDQRTLRNQGPVSVAAIDAVMANYLQTENLRGAALAIARGGRLVYAQGYTFAEPGYPDLTPQTAFRQASVSKTFTGVAMMRLLQDMPSITLDTKVQSIMHLRQPDGSAPADARWADITLRHLLESDSGIPQGLMYASADAAAAFGAPLPATHAQLLSYATTKALTGKPGDKNNSVYGNFDYMFLGEIVARLHGSSSFEQALKDLVLTPLGQAHTHGSRSRVADQPAGEARHHMTVYHPTASWPLFPFEVQGTVREPGQKLVATHYGALDYEMFTGAGGLSASVVDMARLGAMFSVTTNNPVLQATTIANQMKAVVTAETTLKTSDGKNSHGYYGLDWASHDASSPDVWTAQKGGWLPGQGTVLQFTTGGFTYALAINGNADVSFDWLTPIAAAAQDHAWSSDDLFHTVYGMASLAPAAPTVAKLAPSQLRPTQALASVRDAMALGRPQPRGAH